MKRMTSPLAPMSLPVRTTELRTTGRRLLYGSATAASAVALVVSLAPGAGAAEERAAAGSEAEYVSNAEVLDAPTLTTSTTGQEDSGLLLLTPGSTSQGGGGAYGGAAIYDNSGELVWYQEGSYVNLQEITFEGESALAMYETSGAQGGQVVILDSSYTEVASFSMDGYTADYHSLAFNDDGTRALLASYNSVSYDLSDYGGSANGQVTDMVIQEIDTQTGEVTFEWEALDHIPVDETHESLTGRSVDYVHTNSLAYTTDGNILMSGRHTSTLYKIDVDTGELVWRFGGENSDFTFDDDEEMPSYQHDASQLSDGRLVAFDNGNGRDPQYSRGSVWEIDEQTMTADLVGDLQPEDQIFASFTGSNQPTPNGNQLVDYGDSGEIVEFNDSGERVFTATIEGSFTYRAERATDWEATLSSSPDVAWTTAADDGSRELYMSWNGATEVDSWRIEARSSEDGDGFEPVKTVEKTGFETEADAAVPEDADVVRVSALDEEGRVLGSRTLTEGVSETVSETVSE